MKSRQLALAHEVRLALNEHLESLPASATERLAQARAAALARKKRESKLRALAFRHVFAGAGGTRHAPSWLGIAAASALPVLALAAGLAGIYHFEQQRRIADLAEIDAEMLADELPLSAYLDHGFNAYLAKRSD